jgi:hypothetical protein
MRSAEWRKGEGFQLRIVDCRLWIEAGVSWIHVSSKDFCVWLRDIEHGLTYKDFLSRRKG